MLKLADITPEPDLLGGFDLRRAIGIGAALGMMRGRGPDPRPPTRECVRRWIVRGCPVKGQLLRLRARFIGNEYLLMPEWVQEFEAERARLGTLNPLADEVPNRTRQAQIRAAEKALDAAKIGTPKRQ